MSGTNKASTVQISRRPSNISNDKIHLANRENWAKLLNGPTAPIPGPTLPSVAATALNDVAGL